MRELPEVHGARHRFIEANGISFHVAEVGDPAAPPVVFLHGFPQHWYGWRRVVPRLSQNHRLILPDLRGFGWSDAPRRGYDTKTRVDDVLAIMDVLDLPQAQLVGQDWGAWLGFMACLRAPDRFVRFVALGMIHPWPRRSALARHAWRQWYTALWEYPLIGTWVLRRWPGLTKYILRKGVRDPDVWLASDLDEFAGSVQSLERARAGQSLHWHYVLRDIPELLLQRRRPEELTVPTRLLFGEADFAMSSAVLRASAANAPHIEVQIVDAGHLLAEDRPDLVALAVGHNTALVTGVDG